MTSAPWPKVAVAWPRATITVQWALSPNGDSGHAAAQPGHTPIEERAMSWKAPKVVEIALGAEINSYACAEAKK